MRRTLLAVLLLVAVAAPVSAEELAVIVHGGRSDRPSLAEIAQIYLKQRRFWTDGERIVAVNRESGSSARAKSRTKSRRTMIHLLLGSLNRFGNGQE